jgi:iron(III) transport system permease protein
MNSTSLIRSWPPGRILLTLVGGAVAVCLMAPVAVLLLDARAAGWHEVRTVLFRERSATLLANTVTLTVLVGVTAAVIGTAAAWCVERRTVPWRKLWTVLLILPMAMPDFVVGFAWHSLLPTMSPLLAATLIMTLSTYPLVFLPVAAVLRRSDPTLEDVAHGLGHGSVATFLRVTLPSIRGAIGGGVLLAALTVISEYGAFEAVRFHTLTTEIFTEFQFEPQAAAALSIPLVLLGLLAIGIDAAIPRRRSGFGAQTRAGRTARVGRGVTGGQVLAMTAFAATVVTGVIFPVAVLLYWIRRSQHTTLPAVASLGTATETTFNYSALSAAAVVILAVPVAYLSVRYPSRLSLAVQASTFISRAIPGVIVALSLGYLAINYLFPLYETSSLVIAAYTVLFFPLGLVCVQATVAHVPRELGDIARSLGRGQAYVFFRVTLPLIGPGLLAGFCLVFVTATTELTSTLMLAPIGVKTLATQFWAFQTESAYGAAAPYALVIVAVSVLPGALIGLWFDRGQRSATPGRDAPVSAVSAQGRVLRPTVEHVDAAALP